MSTSFWSLYGKGDHGGGPMADMMDRAVTMMHDPDYPTVRFRKGVDYFREVEAMPQAKDLPVVDDELYVKTHRGTFTTDSQVKRDNRRSEVLLMNAEKFSLLASQFGQPYPQSHSGFVGEGALRRRCMTTSMARPWRRSIATRPPIMPTSKPRAVRFWTPRLQPLANMSTLRARGKPY